MLLEVFDRSAKDPAETQEEGLKIFNRSFFFTPSLRTYSASSTWEKEKFLSDISRPYDLKKIWHISCRQALSILLLLTTIILFFPFITDLCMVWIFIAIFFLLILCWLFLTPLELQIDTRTPQASLRWISIGKAIVTYENEKWWLTIRVLFFYKQWDLEKLIFTEKKKKKRVKPIPQKRKTGKSKRIRKFFNLVKTFRVTNWQIAIDTGDTLKNAWLYPLNFSSYTWKHLYINFVDENYLAVTIRNSPWKLAYAFLR